MGEILHTQYMGIMVQRHSYGICNRPKCQKTQTIFSWSDKTEQGI